MVDEYRDKDFAYNNTKRRSAFKFNNQKKPLYEKRAVNSDGYGNNIFDSKPSNPTIP